MSKFQDFWKNSNGQVGKAVQLVVQYETPQNGCNTRVFETENEYAEWLLEMGSNVTITGMRKSGVGDLVRKPGSSVHTEQWARCVEHVRSQGGGADPYAVCTAMLGDESFKAMEEVDRNSVIDKALAGMSKDSFGIGGFGIAGAGPIPESKLARQDLEGTSKAFSSRDDLIGRIARNQKATVQKGSSFKDMWSRIKPR